MATGTTPETDLINAAAAVLDKHAVYFNHGVDDSTRYWTPPDSFRQLVIASVQIVLPFVTGVAGLVAGSRLIGARAQDGLVSPPDLADAIKAAQGPQLANIQAAVNDLREYLEQNGWPQKVAEQDSKVLVVNVFNVLHKTTMTVGDITMGDIFTNISNSSIVNRSVVERSFNKIKGSHDEETARALVRVADEIAKANNKPAAELFTAFNEEVQKDEPRKSILASLWSGIVEAVPSIAQLVDVVTKISSLFT